MSRILRIELRRSVALPLALLVLVAGAGLISLDTMTWTTGWMPLARSMREFLVLLWPAALAAGAWQARREQRSHVGELFASTARPRAQRVAPTLTALAVAVVAGYLAIGAVIVPWILDTASYVSPAVFVTVAVGALSLIAAAWLGMGVGRLAPNLVTAPALAVAGLALLLFAPAVAGHRQWLFAAFAPTGGMGLYTDFMTVQGRTSAAQTIWLVALAVTGVVLLATGTRRARTAALLPVVLGAAVAYAVIPRGDDFVESAIDPVARELVCTEDAPKVCVARIREKLLPELTGQAREGLTLLAKLPNPPTTAVEDTSTFLDGDTPAPPPGTVLFSVWTGRNGHLDDRFQFLPTMLEAGGVQTYHCPGTLNSAVARAAAYWLIGREPVGLPGEDPETLAETRTLWQGLQALPQQKAAARVAAVREAAAACKSIDGLL